MASTTQPSSVFMSLAEHRALLQKREKSTVPLDEAGALLKEIALLDLMKNCSLGEEDYS